MMGQNGPENPENGLGNVCLSPVHPKTAAAARRPQK